MKGSKLEMWIDGSTRNNGYQENYGGWGVYCTIDKEYAASWNGGVCNTTNQRMELTAAIQAIDKYETIKQDYQINKLIIYTDSAYLYNCWKEKWYKKWIEKDWTNSKQMPVANKDLWEKLIPYFKDKTIKFVKVKGHSTNEGNIEADALATEAADELMRRRTSKNENNYN